MPGFGFGPKRARARLLRQVLGIAPIAVSYGALSRNSSGAGIATTATAITAGDPLGHWTVADGRLYPSSLGDSAELAAGPYMLSLDNGDRLQVTIEADTWDVATQAEWTAVATQPAAVLAGRTIALRNNTAISLGITGASGTPFRRVDLRAGGRPLTVKGRFGATGDFASYCEIDKVQQLRGTRGLFFHHLRTSPVAESKFACVGEAANHVEDITIDDCWVSGQVADPNGDYSTSSAYPNLGKDLIHTTGSATGSVGNFTVTNCRLQWGATLVNIAVTKPGHAAKITGNHYSHFYDDGLSVAMSAAGTSPDVIIAGNFGHDPVGQSTDSANPHPDFIRLVANALATEDWDGILIENNVQLQGTARGGAQGIFLDDLKTQAADSGHFFVATVRGNLSVLHSAVHSITIVQAKDCLVERNTVVSWDRASSFTPLIFVGAAGITASNGGGNVVRDNIADGIAAGANDSLSGNHAAGMNGSAIDYASLFTGPGWTPSTLAAARAAFTPLVAAGADSS